MLITGSTSSPLLATPQPAPPLEVGAMDTLCAALKRVRDESGDRQARLDSKIRRVERVFTEKLEELESRTSEQLDAAVLQKDHDLGELGERCRIVSDLFAEDIVNLALGTIAIEKDLYSFTRVQDRLESERGTSRRSARSLIIVGSMDERSLDYVIKELPLDTSLFFLFPHLSVSANLSIVCCMLSSAFMSIMLGVIFTQLGIRRWRYMKDGLPANFEMRSCKLGGDAMHWCSICEELGSYTTGPGQVLTTVMIAILALETLRHIFHSIDFILALLGLPQASNSKVEFHLRRVSVAKITARRAFFGVCCATTQVFIKLFILASGVLLLSGEVEVMSVVLIGLAVFTVMRWDELFFCLVLQRKVQTMMRNMQVLQSAKVTCLLAPIIRRRFGLSLLFFGLVEFLALFLIHQPLQVAAHAVCDGP